jgi:hypothetical protein
MVGSQVAHQLRKASGGRMNTFEQIAAKTRELQQHHWRGVHRQDIQDEIQRLYARYRAERAAVASPELPEPQPAPPNPPPEKAQRKRAVHPPRKPNKLSDDQVLEIRRRYAAEGGRRGLQKELCQEFGVKKGTLWDIVRGHTHRHLL